MSDLVNNMFANISGKYDLLNDLLSFGIHHRWRKIAVKQAAPEDGMMILDTACGTGDLSFSFYKHLEGNCKITATDFCESMLVIAKKKAKNNDINIQFEIADVMNLQYPNNNFDITSISFGIRNVDDTRKGISELARVTKKGGKVVILEFGQADGVFGSLYNFYSKYYMPLVGKLIAGDDYAYSYLPQSAKLFPCKEDFTYVMKSLDVFSEVSYISLSGGIAYIYTGVVR